MAGGFIGLAGPGDLAGTDGGLTVNLLGLNYVLKLSNLLSLGQAVEVKVTDATVSGIADGFSVEATGSRSDNSTVEYAASGFAARSNSTKIENCQVQALKSVTATENGGSAGGFVGISKTGGLAEVGDETSVKALIEAKWISKCSEIPDSFLYRMHCYLCNWWWRSCRYCRRICWRFPEWNRR